jgi:hypothetical protein
MNLNLKLKMKMKMDLKSRGRPKIAPCPSVLVYRQVESVTLGLTQCEAIGKRTVTLARFTDAQAC